MKDDAKKNKDEEKAADGSNKKTNVAEVEADDEEVANLMSSLNIENNLDHEEEGQDGKTHGEEAASNLNNFDDDGDGESDDDEVIESLGSARSTCEENNGETFASKGPQFREKYQYGARKVPYQPRPENVPKNDTFCTPGTFVDDAVEVYTVFNRLVAEAPASAAADVPCLPNVKTDTEISPRILFRNAFDQMYHVLPVSVSMTLDTQLKKIGVWIPKMVLNNTVDYDKMSGTVQLYIQLDPAKRRLVKFVGKVFAQDGSLQAAFVHLSPFTMSGASYCMVEALVAGIDEVELQNAIRLANSKDMAELTKSYGKNGESFLMALCNKRHENQTLRARVFALVARIINHAPKGAARTIIVKKDGHGLTALDFATGGNNKLITAFLAELFYIYDQDILGTDANGYTILHVMARKGDVAVSMLQHMLRLSYRNPNKSERRVYSLDVENPKMELPIHIAAMSKTCPHQMINLLVNNMPSSLSARKADGSMPIHIACQRSADPSLVALLLSHKPAVVNARRADELTPLHLVAMRSPNPDKRFCLGRLDEAAQMDMVRVLLEFGADKLVKIGGGGLTPLDLVPEKHFKVREFMKLDMPVREKHTSGGSCADESGSPTTIMPNMNGLDWTPSPADYGAGADPFFGCEASIATGAAGQAAGSGSGGAYFGRVPGSVSSIGSEDSDDDNNAVKMFNDIEDMLKSQNYDGCVQLLSHNSTIQEALGRIEAFDIL